MSNRLEIQKDIEKVLEKSCLNRAQIKKRVTFQWINKNHINLKVDLHGLNLRETIDIIDILFNTNKLDIVVIEFIHGYKRGRVLKDYIEKDFHHLRLDQGRHRLFNEGVTTLYLKPWNEVMKADNKSKINLLKHKSKSNKQVEVSEGDIANNSLFRVTMIKEKVRAAIISEPFTYEAYSHILDQEQMGTIKPLLDILLTKEEFLLRIFNLYSYKDTLYVDVSFNKLTLSQVSILLDKLLRLESETQIILTLSHKNKKDLIIKNHIKEIIKDNISFEGHVDGDDSSTIIRFLTSKKTQ